MAEHWYQLVESDDGFLKSAPFRYENSVEVPAPPERTWELLTTDDTLVSWTRLVTSLRWLSPRPFGVGTVRELTLLGLLTGRERYFRWEEGKRNSYSVVALSFPGIRRWAEDYIVEPTHSGSRLTWTLAIEPVPLLKPILLASKPITSVVTRHVLQSIRSHVGC